MFDLDVPIFLAISSCVSHLAIRAATSCFLIAKRGLRLSYSLRTSSFWSALVLKPENDGRLAVFILEIYRSSF